MPNAQKGCAEGATHTAGRPRNGSSKDTSCSCTPSKHASLEGGALRASQCNSKTARRRRRRWDSRQGEGGMRGEAVAFSAVQGSKGGANTKAPTQVSRKGADVHAGATRHSDDRLETTAHARSTSLTCVWTWPCAASAPRGGRHPSTPTSLTCLQQPRAPAAPPPLVPERSSTQHSFTSLNNTHTHTQTRTRRRTHTRHDRAHSRSQNAPECTPGRRSPTLLTPGAAVDG